MRERAQGAKTQGGPHPETRPGRGPTSEGVRATPPGGLQVRAALYARVSTEEQAERYGLASQVTELRELATRKGYEIVAELSDDGVSGATLDRPALTRLRDQVRAGAYQAVLAHAPDRLSRNLAHQLLLLEEFKKADCAVVFLTTPTEDTAEGRLLLNVSGVVAEFEREKIKERTVLRQNSVRRQVIDLSAPVARRSRPNGHSPATPA